jgi:hypothetical protein
MYIGAISMYHLDRPVMANRSTWLANILWLSLSLLVLISASSFSIVNASPIYVEDIPDYVRVLRFPQVSSRLDSKGNLWVFWRDDSALYYSRADPSTWDWTTPYTDYMRAIPPELGIMDWENGYTYAMAAELALILALITVSGLWIGIKLRGLRGNSGLASGPHRRSSRRSLHSPRR